MTKLTKVEYIPTKIEGEVTYVDHHTGPPYYEYGVRFADGKGRSLGYMQCGWSTSKRSADALMRAAVVRMTSVVSTTSEKSNEQRASAGRKRTHPRRADAVRRTARRKA